MMNSASLTRSQKHIIVLAGGSHTEASAITRSLRELGHSCLFSPDYRTFEQFVRWLNPELILLDGEDYDFLRCFIGGRHAGLAPTIHLVSHAVNMRRAFAVGATDCIVKPVLTEELQACVNVYRQLHEMRHLHLESLSAGI
ncbi:hypothetical protein [Sinorhizobium meliloti]|uniref:hypothetical protein n=1 Tax=Rhizobium meliloti TaxID=382 RepID=UPI00209031DF|nr:hypothetical protein [Sinorhizobium meliloti]MCO5965384.1 hypothetical protein [Sinorhizobium meliloti]